VGEQHIDLSQNCPALPLSPSSHNYKLLILKVPEAGLEPASPFGRRILSPLRIPFRHSGGDRRSAADMVISDQSIAKKAWVVRGGERLR
jgi:hypothetical protein